MSFRALWHRITTTRYTLSLERELIRLRAENRALLNSILGIAGVPPVPAEDLPAGFDSSGIRNGASFGERVHKLGAAGAVKVRPPATKALSGTNGEGHGALPLRRRSWQQINRMLELESARKKAEA